MFLSNFFSDSYLFAYLGPGMGGGVIAAIFGLIAAFFLGLWGILYYPIKRALKNRSNKKNKINNKISKNKTFKLLISFFLLFVFYRSNYLLGLISQVYCLHF